MLVTVVAVNNFVWVSVLRHSVYCAPGTSEFVGTQNAPPPPSTKSYFWAERGRWEVVFLTAPSVKEEVSFVWSSERLPRRRCQQSDAARWLGGLSVYVSYDCTNKEWKEWVEQLRHLALAPRGVCVFVRVTTCTRTHNTQGVCDVQRSGRRWCWHRGRGKARRRMKHVASLSRKSAQRVSLAKRGGGEEGAALLPFFSRCAKKLQTSVIPISSFLAQQIARWLGTREGNDATGRDITPTLLHPPHTHTTPLQPSLPRNKTSRPSSPNTF